GDTLKRNLEHAESVAYRYSRGISLGQYELVGARAQESVARGDVVEAREDGQVGAQSAKSLHGQPRAIGLGHGDHGERRAINTRVLENPAVPGIAEEAGHAARGQSLDHIGIELDHEIADAEALEGLADGASHAPEAAEDDMIAKPRPLDGQLLPMASTAQAELAHPALHGAEERSVEQNRDERGGQRRLVHVLADVPGAARDLHEDERELADLRQARADEEGSG